MELTPLERTLMGALVQVNKDIKYPHFKIEAWTGGTIFDFVKESGNPFVSFHNGKEGIVDWKDLIVVKHQEQNT